MAVGRLNYTFEFGSISYMADIIHFEYLTPDEIEKYGITENTYLVHLFTLDSLKSFELFIGENLEWQTNCDFKIDGEIIQIIGLEIHNRSM